MKCKKCGFEWMDNEKFSNLTKCLFCGEDLFPKKELSKEPTMAEVLVYIKENYGEEVFKEGSKLLGMFGDLAPKLKSEYRILDIAVRNHIERYFAGVKESDIEISINKFKNDFGDFMNEKTLNTLTEAFVKVFHQNYKLNKEISKNNETYNRFNIGDTFDFGNYNNEPIKWKVLRKDKDSIFVISCESLCKREFKDYSLGDILSGKVKDANEWEKSDLRKWLNGEFYDEAFSNEEKGMIKLTESDKVTLLTIEEAETLMTEEERKRGTWWWLRSPYPNDCDFVWYVNCDGDIDYYDYYANDSGGVCPALHLKF